MLMYPKKTIQKKRRIKHPPSILGSRSDRCYLCELKTGMINQRNLEKHHIFGGPERTKSEANGFVAWLCVEHHREGPFAVHINAKVRKQLQSICQKRYERDHSRDQWMELMGRNYIDTD